MVGTNTYKGWNFSGWNEELQRSSSGILWFNHLFWLWQFTDFIACGILTVFRFTANEAKKNNFKKKDLVRFDNKQCVILLIKVLMGFFSCLASSVCWSLSQFRHCNSGLHSTENNHEVQHLEADRISETLAMRKEENRLHQQLGRQLQRSRATQLEGGRIVNLTNNQATQSLDRRRNSKRARRETNQVNKTIVAQDDIQERRKIRSTRLL